MFLDHKVCGAVPVTWLLMWLCFFPAYRAASDNPIVEITKGPLVEPSYRSGQLTVRLLLSNSTATAVTLQPRIVITDHATQEVAVRPAAAEITVPAGFAGERETLVSADGLKTWSHWDPNLYYLDMELLHNGEPIAVLPRIRFGYREVWVEGGQFYINGKKVFFWGGNHDGRRRETEMRAAKTANFNADTLRGGHLQAEAFDLSDLTGHYVFYFGDAVNLDFIYKVGNHPSLIGYASHMSGYYPGPHGHPMQIGGIIPPEVEEKELKKIYMRYYADSIRTHTVSGSVRRGDSAMALNRISRDPTRLYGHYVRGVGGDFRSLMWDLGWGVPAQSQEEWFKVYTENREHIEPFFGQEFALMRLGANMVNMNRRGGASTLVEHCARYFGDEAYRLYDDSMLESYNPGAEFPRNEVFSHLFYKQKEHIYSRVFPIWRAGRVGGMLLHVDGHPGRIGTRDGNVTPLGAVLRDVFAPVLFFLAGPKDDITDKDHNFYAGETISKSAVIVNDTAGPAVAAVDWQVADPSGTVVGRGSGEVNVLQGDVAFLAIDFPAPEVAAKTRLLISATGSLGDEPLNAAPLDVTVFPRQTGALESDGKTVLIDETGETAAALDKAGRTYHRLTADMADSLKSDLLRDADLLLIGRLSYPLAVDIMGEQPWEELLAAGMNTIVLAQRNRHVMGLLMEHTGARDVYIRSKAPLLDGYDNRDFSEWRGETTLLPAYPPFQGAWWGWSRGPGTDLFSLHGQFNSWGQRRAWHWSNKATVADFQYQKPQLGNFRIFIDSHFDLLYSPLIEFQYGQGRLLLCTLDVVERYGKEPVATTLLDKILTEYSRRGSETLQPVGVIGDAAEESMAGFRMDTRRDIHKDTQVVFMLPDDWTGLADNQLSALTAFMEGGGVVLTSVVTGDQAARLPVEVILEPAEVFNPDLPEHPAFDGLGMSDLFWRKTHVYQAIRKINGAPAVIAGSGIAAVAEIGKGKLVLLQVAPDALADEPDYAWGRTKVLRLFSSLLTNLGGRSLVNPDLRAIGGWGIPDEWMSGYTDGVPRGAPRIGDSELYLQKPFSWDPDMHRSW